MSAATKIQRTIFSASIPQALYLRNIQPFLSIVHGLLGIFLGVLGIPVLPVRAETWGERKQKSIKER